MVSTGDTEISLHIRSPKTLELPKSQSSGGRGEGRGGGEGGRGLYSGVRTENTQSSKICLNFNLGGGGYSGVRTENTQSAKICLNFNFQGGITQESELKILKVPRSA